MIQICLSIKILRMCENLNSEGKHATTLSSSTKLSPSFSLMIISHSHYFLDQEYLFVLTKHLLTPIKHLTCSYETPTWIPDRLETSIQPKLIDNGGGYERSCESKAARWYCAWCVTALPVSYILPLSFKQSNQAVANSQPEASSNVIRNNPKVAKAVASTGIGAAVTSGFAVPALGFLGFAPTGIVGGSLAAGYQSSVGLITAGSWFATLQSATTGGGAAMTGVLTGAAAVGGAITGVTNWAMNTLRG